MNTAKQQFKKIKSSNGSRREADLIDISGPENNNIKIIYQPFYFYSFKLYPQMRYHIK